MRSTMLCCWSRRDRISAFDHVLGTGIPGKGKILTQISLFWFDLLSDIVPNHLIAADVKDFPAELQPFADQLEGRSMLVKRAEMFPVECVARGYLAGSGWKDYQATALCAAFRFRRACRMDRDCPSPFSPRRPRARTARTTKISRLRTHRGTAWRGRCSRTAPPHTGHLCKGGGARRIARTDSCGHQIRVWPGEWSRSFLPMKS